MQDIHSFETTGGGAGLFAGGGDRRLKHHHQDLNCPRCDSSNTKFCYYNNYNLSQPRHFCKSCRRYWTKGGVFRNVPVGGGIRKPKRSNKPKSKPSIPCSDAGATEHKSSNSENSSSDSSSLTANTTTRNATATATATADVSGSNSTNSTPAMMINFNESSRRFFSIPQSSTPITTSDSLMLNQSSAGNASSEIGMFTSMMASSADQLSGVPSFQLQQKNMEVENRNCNQLQWTSVETTGFMDQSRTADIEFSGYGSRRNNGGIAGTEDWQESGDEGLFNLAGSVDQSYWNQHHWNDEDHDHHLNYIP